jgi:hypothetical protein
MIKKSILSVLLIISINGCVSSKQESFEQKMALEQENKKKMFNESKLEIDNWISKVERIDLKPNQVISPIELTKDIENGLINNVTYTRNNLNTEKIFNDYYSQKTIYKNITLSDFLNNYEFARGTQLEVKYKNILVNTYGMIFLTLNNLEKDNKLKIGSVYNSYLPEVYISSNKDIQIEFIHNENGVSNNLIQLKITNLTKKYVDIETISISIDSIIKNTNINLRLPPNAMSNYYNIEMPWGANIYKKVNSLKEGSTEISVAAMYKIDNKTETFLEGKILKP